MRGTKKLAGIAVIGASIAGCGSSSSTLNRAQLVAQANAICTTAQKAASAVPAPTNLTDPNAAAAYFDKIAPITQTETDALSALKPDSQAAGDWNAFIATQRAANSLLQTIRQKADAKDVTGLQDLKKVPTAGNRVLAAATKLGARVCAQ